MGEARDGVFCEAMQSEAKQSKATRKWAWCAVKKREVRCEMLETRMPFRLLRIRNMILSRFPWSSLVEYAAGQFAAKEERETDYWRHACKRKSE